MKKIIVGVLLVTVIALFFFTNKKPEVKPVLKPEQKPASVLVNKLNYEPGLASSAISHKDIFSIKYGSADNNVGGNDQDTDENRIGGAPTAYRSLADGSLWVLDTISQKLKHFSAKGALLSCLKFPGSSDTKFVYFTDFVIIPTGGFYIYDSTQGIISRINEKGEAQVQIEGLPFTSEIGVDSKGNLLVVNPVMQAVLRFNPAGELIERYSNQNSLSSVVDAYDRPLGVKFNDTEAELFCAVQASPTKVVSIAKYPIQTKKEQKAYYVSAKLLGADAKNNVYLQLVACNSVGVIHQYSVMRLNEKGTILKQANLLAIPFVLPRREVITPDGRILSFRSDKIVWSPITYSLP